MLRFIITWFLKITGYIPQKILFKTKIYYEDKKRQSRKIKKGAIVMPNHRSVYDFAVMLFTFPLRTLRCVVAEVMWNKNFVFSLFLKGLGAIKVDRHANDFEFLDKCEKILNRNGVVEIFPETRLPKKGEKTPLEFKTSTALLALKTGAPIIPVFTDGNYFKKSRNNTIIGVPINVRDMYDDNLSERQNLINITTKLREKIIELENELNRQKENERAKKEKAK